MNVGSSITFENGCVNINGFVDGGKVIVLSKSKYDKNYHVAYSKQIPENITIAKKYLAAYQRAFQSLENCEFYTQEKEK